MTDQYAELRAAMDAATPGPWHTNTQCPGLCCWHIFPSVPMFGAGEDAPIVMGECSEADARFMTLARNALPALLAERDALREALQEMVDIAEKVDGWQSFPQGPIERARAALTQQEQGEKHDNQD